MTDPLSADLASLRIDRSEARASHAKQPRPTARKSSRSLVAGASVVVLTAAIVLPGTLVGLIVGFATQKYGKSPATANS